MKKIEAIIRPSKLEDMKQALHDIHVDGVTISQVMGCGKQRGWKEYYRGTEVSMNVLPKIRIEVVVSDEKIEDVIEKIIDVAQTGEVGDGKIFVYDVIECVRIRTRERGDTAL